MSGDLPRPRDSLAEATPYRTDTHEAEVRLQSNEWTEPTPLGRYLSPADLESAVINRYPDIAAAKLRTLLARRWGVTPEQVILGNGSNEVLLYTFLVFGGPDRTLLVFTPTYTMYARLGRLTGMRVHEEGVGVPYTLDARRVRDAVARVRPDVVCFSSPNNPTGGLIDDATIRAATALHARRLARGVLVRGVSSWPGAGESRRATIGSPAENDRLLDALRGILAERGR